MYMTTYNLSLYCTGSTYFPVCACVKWVRDCFCLSVHTYTCLYVCPPKVKTTRECSSGLRLESRKYSNAG